MRFQNLEDMLHKKINHKKKKETGVTIVADRPRTPVDIQTFTPPKSMNMTIVMPKHPEWLETERYVDIDTPRRFRKKK